MKNKLSHSGYPAVLAGLNWYLCSLFISFCLLFSYLEVSEKEIKCVFATFSCSVQLYLDFIANLALGADILQDFHKTQRGVLFGSVVHLQTFCHYLFCYSVTFPIKTSLLKMFGSWCSSYNGEGCGSHVKWPFLLLNLEVSKCFKVLSVYESWHYLSVWEKVLSICFRIVFLEGVSLRKFFCNFFK